jgi:hypothetical protein
LGLAPAEALKAPSVAGRTLADNLRARSDEMDLLEIARKAITLGLALTTDEQAAWDALSVGERIKLEAKARERELAKYQRQLRRDVRQHGEPARRHYASMSHDTQQALGVAHLLQAPKVAQSQKRPRARGAGRPRASATRSSAKSGDSGEDGEPPERLCACGCRAGIGHRAPQAKYLNDQHGDADRQRRKRARERGALTTRRDPYLRFDDRPLEAIVRRIEQGCRCNGHHIADAEDGHCIKCGHRSGWSMPIGYTIAAQSAETRRARGVIA